MPDVKISGLPAGTVTGVSTVPAVSGSVTHKTTVQASTAAGLAAYSTNIGNSTLAVGGATLAGNHIRATGSAAGTTVWQTFYADPLTAADVQTTRSYNSFPSTAAGSYTTTQITGYFAGGGTKGAGTTVTTAIGFFAHQTMAMADTVNYGFFGALPANGTVNWNVYMNGTAPNYFAGNVRIGTTSQGISGYSVFDVVGRSCLVGAGAGEAFALALKHSTAGVNCYLGANATGDFIVSNGSGVAMLTVSQAAGNAVTLAGNSLRISTSSTPTSAATAGNAGEIRWDSGYLYVCTTTGAAGAAVWKRAALTAV